MQIFLSSYLDVSGQVLPLFTGHILYSSLFARIILMRHAAIWLSRVESIFSPQSRNFPSCLFCRSTSVLHYHQTQIKEYQAYINELLDFLNNLLRRCRTIQHCNQIHAHSLITGCCCSPFLSARIISVYAHFGRLFDAQKVFDTAPFCCLSNSLLWNSILRVNVTQDHHEDALQLYADMKRVGGLADGFTFPLVIRACAHMGMPSLCRAIHGHVLQMGFHDHLHVANELIGMYAKQGQMGNAHNVFDRMTIRTYISWNTMVSGYAFNYDCNGAVQIFQRMQSQGLEPNLVTWTSLLSSHARCGHREETIELFGLMRMRQIEVSAEALAVILSCFADLGEVDRGKVIHGYIIKGGFVDYSFVITTLISLYGNHADVNAATELFLGMKSRNLASWNALITSHAEAGLCDEALEIFTRLERSEDSPTLRPNVVSWSALIDGFASKGRGEESLELFRRMQLAKVLANAVTISTVLSVCAELAALNLGREIHGHVIRALLDHNILVENGLVNMYTKCGCLREGKLVFEKIKKKDLISWNSMITGYGMHGHGLNALEIFEQMIKLGFKPDGITFVAILSACSHAGLVPEGRRLFDQMIKEHRIEPQMEHYACMVDLLGRAGLLQEAYEIVKNMPIEPNACVKGALLNSCRMHNNAEVAEEIASNIVSLNLREMTGNYMLLSNIYAANGRWEDFARVRTSARTKGLKKNRGESWVKVKNNVCMFSAGNNIQKGFEQVFGALEELTLQMESEGHVHDCGIIPLDS